MRQRRNQLPKQGSLLPSTLEIKKTASRGSPRSCGVILSTFFIALLYLHLVTNEQTANKQSSSDEMLLNLNKIPSEIPISYTKTPPTQPCTLTVVIAEPSLPLLPGNDMAYASSLESTAEYAPAGSCLMIQTSGCRIRQIVDEMNVHPANVVVGESNNKASSDDNNINNKYNYSSWTTRQLVSTSILHRSGPHLTHWIKSGRVRLSLLNHTQYNSPACDSYNANALWMNSNYYVNEFVEYDNDLVLFIQRDSFLCRELDVEPWRKFAYVGGPWIKDHARLGISSVRDFWRNRRNGGFRIRVDTTKGEDGGSYSIDEWKRYWQTEHGKGCSMEYGLNNCSIHLHPPHFPNDYPSEETKLHNNNNNNNNKRISAMVGNGGFSLRSRTWMLRAIHVCPYPPYAQLSANISDTASCIAHEGMRLQEDVYFSAILGAIGAPLPTPLEAQLFCQEEPWSDSLVPNTSVRNEAVVSLFGTGEKNEHANSSIKSFMSIAFHKCWEPANCPSRNECKYSTPEVEKFESRFLWWLWSVVVRLWLWLQDAMNLNG